jgi:hypothetical protein
MGFEPQQPRSTLESANEFAEHIALGIEEAKAALTKAKDEYTMLYNRRREPALVFAPGDRVWLDGSDITTNRPLSKLSHQHLGPLADDLCRLHPQLSSMVRRSMRSRLSWTAECVTTRLEYLLKFKGYDKSHNQWEAHTQVHAKPKIALFHCKYPVAARHINAAIFDSIPFTRADLATSWRSSC